MTAYAIAAHFDKCNINNLYYLYHFIYHKNLVYKMSFIANHENKEN